MRSTRLSIAALLIALAAACGSPTDAAKRPNYVALGDSVAAAPGVPDPAPPAGCQKSTNNYPSILARRLAAAKFTDVTCSGATTENILSRTQQTMSGVSARQIDAVSATTDLITITIGANDVGLASDFAECEVKTADPPSCTKGFVVHDVDLISAVIRRQKPLWNSLIDDVRAKAPHARIIWVGYGVLIRPGGCFPGQPVLPHDSDYLQSKVNELDDQERELAAAKHIEYFDARPMTLNHDMCASPADRYVEGYITKPPAVRLHPTASGSAAVGNALADLISRPSSSG